MMQLCIQSKFLICDQYFFCANQHQMADNILTFDSAGFSKRNESMKLFSLSVVKFNGEKKMKIISQPFVMSLLVYFIGFVVVTLVCVNLIAALTNKWWMWNMKLFAKMVVLVVLKRVLATKRFSEPFTKLLTNVPRTKNSNTYTYTNTFSHMYHIFIIQ